MFVSFASLRGLSGRLGKVERNVIVGCRPRRDTRQRDKAVIVHDPTQQATFNRFDFVNHCVVCADSDTWHKVGATSKDCAWVGRKPDTRCMAKGTEEGHMAKIEAWYACGASCWGCHSDSESWFKRGSPAKTCAWVGAYPEKRCSVKGDDKTLASDACPTSCE